jgi:hypothetical protein
MNHAPNTDDVGELRALQRDVTPPRDLWPAIEAAIRDDSRSRRMPTVATRSSRVRSGLGLVAGLALLATGVWIGRVLLPPTQPGVAVDAGAQPAALQVARFAPGAAYEAARAAELAQVAERLAALPQPARAQVQASLETLQSSIDAISAALGQEPANALLQSLLIDTYQEQMRVLTTLNTAAASGEEI